LHGRDGDSKLLRANSSLLGVLANGYKIHDRLPGSLRAARLEKFPRPASTMTVILAGRELLLGFVAGRLAFWRSSPGGSSWAATTARDRYARLWPAGQMCQEAASFLSGPPGLLRRDGILNVDARATLVGVSMARRRATRLPRQRPLHGGLFGKAVDRSWYNTSSLSCELGPPAPLIGAGKRWL